MQFDVVHFDDKVTYANAYELFVFITSMNKIGSSVAK